MILEENFCRVEHVAKSALNVNGVKNLSREGVKNSLRELNRLFQGEDGHVIVETIWPGSIYLLGVLTCQP